MQASPPHVQNGFTGNYKVGIDIGGTFTDIVLMDAQQRIHTKKVSSTPANYIDAIVTGLDELLREQGVAPGEVGEVVHATTVGTNAILENKGARTALITTAGFRDVLEFRRVRIPELYNLHHVKPPPLVPRRLRFEVEERMAFDGTVRRPLDENSVRVAARACVAAQVQAVAVCLLHSYINPVHEQRIRAILAEELPAGIFVTCSHEILPEIREYERTSTTVVNAFLGPVVGDYLAQLRARLAALGIGGTLRVMQSGGGQMSVASAIDKPAYLVESGPAAGVIAGARLARDCGRPHVITLDIGGTTAKTAIVENGEPTKTGEFEIGAGINLSSKLVKGAGYAIKLPFIDVTEIGAGGGSHVWFDKGGLLKVGPTSAGASPGPVCYGAGGKQVTLTDALLMLGYINPDYLVGGALRLRRDLTEAAFNEQVCAPLGKPLLQAAHGVFAVAISNMTRAVKSVSTYRGRDPRDFALVAFGGNGGIVAAAIARALEMKSVMIPPNPGVLSSFGLLVADREYELVKALPMPLATFDAARLAEAYAALADEARAALVGATVEAADVEIVHQADLRYIGQAFELTVTLSSADAGPEAMAALFHEEHLKTYAHKSEREPVELVSVRVLARVPSLPPGVTSAAVAATHTGGGRSTAPRKAWFGDEHGLMEARVLTRADLRAGPVAGPAIVEEYDSTCVIPPGCSAHLDDAANIVITLPR